MPTFRITAPDGSTYNVTSDNPNATEQDALAQVQQQAPQLPASIQGIGQGVHRGPALRADLFRQLGNVQRGAVDIIGGGADLLARGANALGFSGTDNPALFPSPQVVEQQNSQARQNIDQSVFGPQDPNALLDKVTRGGSAAVLTAPFGPVSWLKSPSMLTRALGGGVTAAEGGALQDTPGGSNTDFFKRKGLQTGLSFLGGTISQPIAEGVVRTVANGINSLANSGATVARNLTGANGIEQLVAMTRAALAKSGINFDSLDESVKQGLLGDVQNALKSAPAVSPGAVARQAAFRQEGFDPLAPWITRNPVDYGAVENMSHIKGVGDQLAQRQAALDQHLQDRLNQLRGPQQGPQTAGLLATQDLNNYLAGQQGKTNVLYNTFRDVAPNVTGDPQRFANDVFGGLEGQMALGSLPEGIKNIVNGISMGKIPLTPSTLYQLQKMAKPGADGSTNYALGHLRAAIDRELNSISASVGPTGSPFPVTAGTQLPDQQGQYAADVLKMARGQHAQTMGELDSSPLYSGATSGKIAPENFTDRLASASIDDTKSTWDKLGPDSQAAIRSQVYADLKQKAFGNATDNAGKPVAQATFVNYVNDPTNAAKLKIVLGDDGYDAVKRLGTMVEAAKMQPTGSHVNNSKTGGTVASLAFRVSNGLKDAGIWGTTPFANMATKSAAQNALAVPEDALSQRTSLLDPFLTEILARRAGRGTALLAGPNAYPLGMGLLGQSPQ